MFYCIVDTVKWILKGVNMRTYAFTNQKGGVGKSTTTYNIAAGVAALGKKVLLVDLDPQANMTRFLGVTSVNGSITDLLTGDKTAKEIIVKRSDNLHIVPSNLSLSSAEFRLFGEPGRELLLKEGLEAVRGYDYCFIDCPPSLGLLTVNALTYAKDVIIVLQPEFAPLEGVANLVDTIKKIKERLNKHIQVSGVIVTMYDSRIRLHKEVVENVVEFFGDKLYETKIARRSILAEAPSHGKTIFEYASKDKAAKEFADLANEFIKRGAK